MSVFWRLSQAITWIGTRSDDAVTKVPDEVHILKLTGLLNSSAFQDAERELWRALQMGKLQATGIATDGERRVIPSERWRDLRPILDGNIREALEPRPYTGNSFRDVVVTSADVRKRWPATPPKGKRGPKPKIDYLKFERDVHSWIDENGMPDPKLDPGQRQADLERYMMCLYNDAISESQNRVLVTRAIASYMRKYEGL
jgi:hypothetical protein